MFSNFNRDTLDSNTRQTRLTYGGLTPNVTRVFYTQGEIDGWRSVDIQRDLNAETPAMVISGASHCNDLYMWFNELPSIKEARDKIRELVKIWIQ